MEPACQKGVGASAALSGLASATRQPSSSTRTKFEVTMSMWRFSERSARCRESCRQTPNSPGILSAMNSRRRPSQAGMNGVPEGCLRTHRHHRDPLNLPYATLRPVENDDVGLDVSLATEVGQVERQAAPIVSSTGMSTATVLAEVWFMVPAPSGVIPSALGLSRDHHVPFDPVEVRRVSGHHRKSNNLRALIGVTLRDGRLERVERRRRRLQDEQMLSVVANFSLPSDRGFVHRGGGYRRPPDWPQARP